MHALDFPNNIQIETTSRCNASCDFCPYPETSRTQPMGVMEDDLFRSIVEQIAQEPVHLVQPFLNNDPLMDRQIIPRLRLLLASCPHAKIRLTSNGALLSDEIIAGLSELPLETIHISSNGLTPKVYAETMHIDAFKVLRNVNRLWAALQRRGSKTRLVVTAVLLRANRREVIHQRAYWKARGVEFYLNPLNDRAGNLRQERFETQLPFNGEANHTQLRPMPMTSCASVFSFMGIHWNGDVIACCNDWRRANVLGNAARQSLREIWHDAPFMRMRKLSNQGRLDTLPLCGSCGRQRFCIDSGALKDFLGRQRVLDTSEESAWLSAVEGQRAADPDFIQLGLMA